MAVDKFNFIVFEKNPDLYEQIRRIIIGYTVRNNTEADIYWLNDEIHLQQLANLSKTVHIALVNSDYEQLSLNAGKEIFDGDEDTLIVFYGSKAVDLKPYFRSRPVAYVQWENSDISLDSVIREIHGLLCERKMIFTWTNKNTRLFIPENRIIYMQSYKGYVDIVTTDAKRYHILGKLDAVQEKLQNKSFLRIHKSTIINLNHMRSVDRTNKCCVMSNDDKVYISKAYYKAVSTLLESRPYQ